MVLVFLAARVLHLLQFHIPSHGPVQKHIFKNFIIYRDRERALRPSTEISELTYGEKSTL